MEKYIEFLYTLAKKALRNGDIPVSAIIIFNGKIIGKGYNTRHKTNKVIGHAEINAIIDAEKKMKDFRLNECFLITTLKPCDMCLEVIKAARISKVYYILEGHEKSEIQRKIPCKIEQVQLNCLENEFVIKYKQLFLNFFKNLR